MQSSTWKAVLVIVLAFAAGLVTANLPSAFASSATVERDISSKVFTVSIDEVKQSFAFAEHFSGSYDKAITMSDGTTRRIELTPMIHEGVQVVRLKDSGGVTYMALNGTTTNGALMVQLRDKALTDAALTAEGWTLD